MKFIPQILVILSVLTNNGQALNSPLDIVFIVDETKPMNRERKVFKNSVDTLYNILNNQAPGSRVGLVGFGHDDNQPGHDSHPPNLSHIHSLLTSDSIAFATAANGLITSGSARPSFHAIPSIAATVGMGGLPMGYNRNRPFCVVLLTHEPTDGGAKQKAIKYLQNAPNNPNQANAPGIFFPILPGGNDINGHYLPITTATGGSILNLDAFRSDAAAVFDALFLQCNFAVNEISLTPATADLGLEEILTLTIATNQLSGSAVVPLANTPVTMNILDGPDSGQQHFLTSGADGTVTYQYSPSLLSATTINFEVCLDNTPSKCARASATWQNMCADVDCSGLDTNCQTGVCDPKTGTCHPENKKDGTFCVDNNLCTIDTCQGGICIGEETEVLADTTYTQGSLDLNYADNADSNIAITFEYLGTGNGIYLTTFEAVVFNDPACQGNVIGKTEGAILPTGANEIIPNPFTLKITGTAIYPVLEITTKIENFDFSFWNPYTTCSNEADNPSSRFCGEIEFCLEFQTIVCQELHNLVNVNILAELDVDVDCEGDDCIDVHLHRDAVVVVQSSISPVYNILSYPCEAGQGNSLTVTQGDPIKLCFELNPPIQGACIYDIAHFFLVIEDEIFNTIYRILPFSQDIFLYGSGEQYDPPLFPPGPDGATLEFLPPASEFVDTGSSKIASFEGLISIGFGCYCSNTCSGSRLRSNLRVLDGSSSNEYKLVPFIGEKVEWIFPDCFDESCKDCNGLFNLGIGPDICSLADLFSWIFSFFRF